MIGEVKCKHVKGRGNNMVFIFRLEALSQVTLNKRVLT